MNWHLVPLSELEQLLGATPSGLDEETSAGRLAEFGPNQLNDLKKKTVLQMLLHQLNDFMILILVLAAVISGIIGDIMDTVIILIIIVIDALVGFIQEYRAERAMEALKKMTVQQARIMRGGRIRDVSSSALVPGDVILLEAGNIIPADVRFFETRKLLVDESTLTGESQHVEKYPADLSGGVYPPGERTNLGYKGTHIRQGRALAYVIATGMNTELGKIAKMIQQPEPPTPLQKRLAAFGKRLSILIVIICMIIFVTGWLRGEDLLTMLLTSVSLAVAAIPEALPALVTLTLAFGAKNLVKKNVLIRKLAAVETLGSVTYICTDKTGTLTRNEMTVEELYEIPGTTNGFLFENHHALLVAMALNNDVLVGEDGQWMGESTEVALARYAFLHGEGKTDLEQHFPRIGELPFDASRKCMTTFHRTKNGVLVITKGAVDVLLGKLEAGQRELVPSIEQEVNSMAGKGYRVLGYAIKQLERLPEIVMPEEMEAGLTLLGLAGMMDPPREEAKLAVEQCKAAGIIPVMITGDYQVTAMAVAKSLGIVISDEDLLLNGSELERLSQPEFEKIVEKVRVYSRVSPEQKLKIIRALQDKNHFVAMTGDGVNDAPALKNADIGIAMGINGTEVSREASHMILLDDNFASIVAAVRHGRKIFDNILKFIRYIMTGNTGEIWAIFLAPFFGLPIPLLAIQILWINLVTDGLPGLALASEPSEPASMKRAPRHPKMSIFGKGMTVHILWVGLLMGTVTIGLQSWAIHNDLHWQTMSFTVLCFSQMGHVMAIRAERDSIFKAGVFTNKPMIGALMITITLQLIMVYLPFFNEVFKTQPLTFFELGITIAVSSIVFWMVELEKWIKRKVNG